MLLPYTNAVQIRETRVEFAEGVSGLYSLSTVSLRQVLARACRAEKGSRIGAEDVTRHESFDLYFEILQYSGYWSHSVTLDETPEGRRTSLRTLECGK